jgi:amino acid transporter
MKNIIKKSISFASLIFFLLISTSALAQEITPNQNQTNASLADRLSGPTQVMGDSAGFSDVSLGYIIATVIQAALSLLAIIFLVIMVFAGYRWMTASGNEESIKKAQESIKRAIIGLVIVILAYAITAFVFNQLPFDGFQSGNLQTNN